MRGSLIVSLACLLLFGVVPRFAAETSEPQVLAKMGDAVITVQDFLLLAPLLPALAKQKGAEVGKQELLEGLIGRELFAQEAERLGLDQSPKLQAKLKQTRNNILAQEYIQWRSAQGVSIDDEDIKQYF